MRSSPAAVVVRLLQTFGGMLAIALLWWTAGRRLEGWLGGVVDVAFVCYAVTRPAAVVVDWWTTTWSVDERGLRHATGWLARRETVVAWSDVVAVDVSQPFLHRLVNRWTVRVGLGTAERKALRIDAVTAAWRDRVVTLAQAAQLGRDTPVSPAGPASAGSVRPGEPGPTAPGRPLEEVYRMPRSAYLVVSVTYGQFVLFVPAVVSLLDQVGDWVRLPLPDAGAVLAWPLPAQLLGLLAVLLASVAYGWVFAWLRYRGFRVVREGTGYVTSGGLLSRETRTVAGDQVRGLKVTQNPLMRALGYGRVSVLTGDAGEQPMADLLFPAIRLADLPRALGPALSVDPEVVAPRLRVGTSARVRLVAEGVLLAGAAVGLTRWLHPAWTPLVGTVGVVVALLWVNARWVVAAAGTGRSRCYARRGFVWMSHVELDLGAVQVVESSQGPAGRLDGTWSVVLHYADGRPRRLRALGCAEDRRAELVAVATG